MNLNVIQQFFGRWKRGWWPYLIVGLAMAIGWFWFNRRVDFSPYPPMADAVRYSEIASSFKGLDEAFTYAGGRTFGFPFVLYVIKGIAEVFGTLSPETLNAVQTSVLFLFHLICGIGFYVVLERFFFETLGRGLHPIALVLLLAHPGMVSHASVLLTDTFATDLLMIGLALILSARQGSGRSLILKGAVAGLVLGWAVATRPSLSLSLASVLALALCSAAATRAIGRFRLFFAPALCAGSVILLPAMLNCRATYGTVCMQSPVAVSYALSNSIKSGLTSFRMYWSIRSPDPSMIVMPDDQNLLETWGSSCNLSQVDAPRRWLRCIFSRPAYAPIYLGKKLIAVFDSFVLHPYATDVNPTWITRWNRLWSAAAFTGLFFAAAVAAFLARRRQGWAIPVFLAPLILMGFQLPMHIEGRYSFPAIPVCLVSLVWMFQQLPQLRRRERYACLAALAVLGGTFLSQTHYWDVQDPVLQQIEGWNQ